MGNRTVHIAVVSLDGGNGMEDALTHAVNRWNDAHALTSAVITSVPSAADLPHHDVGVALCAGTLPCAGGRDTAQFSSDMDAASNQGVDCYVVFGENGYQAKSRTTGDHEELVAYRGRIIRERTEIHPIPIFPEDGDAAWDAIIRRIMSRFQNASVDEHSNRSDTTSSSLSTARPSRKPTQPKPIQPKPTQPKPTQPKPTQPQPKPIQPKPIQPKPIQPKPTQPSGRPSMPLVPCCYTMRFLRKTTLQYLKQRRSNTLQSLPNNLPVSFCDDVYMPDAIRQEVQDLIVPYEPWKDVLNSYWTLACAIISFNPGNSSPNGAGNDSRQQGYRKGRALKYRELDDAKKLQEIRFKVESTYVKSSMDLEISLTRGADDHNWKVKGVYQEWAVEEPINQFANCVYWNEYERSTYMKSLTEYTATETWTSNTGVSNATPYNLLENYLSLAFCRLKYQDRIVIRTDKNGTWAAFHTGLFSKYNDDIYCLLSRKTGDKDQAKNLRHWHVEGFCTRHEPICGIGYRGNNKFFLVKKLSDMPTVPAPPTYPLYMNNGLLNEHIAGVRDFSKINYDHIILDNNDRLPIRLLWVVLMNELMPESNGKERIIDHWPDPALIVDKDDREQFHSIARQLLSSNHSLMQSMRSHLDHAIDEAVQTMRSSHSIVVGYDPRDTDSIVKMLPLRFSDFKDSPTCALVIKENGRQCEARTVFTLDYAYGCARTVCKPTAPWVLAVLSK